MNRYDHALNRKPNRKPNRKVIKELESVRSDVSGYGTTINPADVRPCSSNTHLTVFPSTTSIPYMYYKSKEVVNEQI